jgi:hypothetical protein
MLGFGAGLLLAQRIPKPRRRPLGWTLLGIGVLSTIPLAILALRKPLERTEEIPIPA